jgi:hypothetical protein
LEAEKEAHREPWKKRKERSPDVPERGDSDDERTTAVAHKEGSGGVIRNTY